MPDAQLVAQRDFSAGQLDPSALRGDDTDIMRAGLRTARNVRILNSRALKRRPGRRILFATTGVAVQVRPVPSDHWYVAFEDGQAVFRDKAQSAEFGLSTTFTGMPWGQDDLTDLTFVEIAGALIVASPAGLPQVFTYDRAARTWSHGAFAFATDPSGAVRQPFYNFFLGSGITMTPSARTGTVNLTFSAAVLDPAHVGVRFRYAERQVQIASVVDAQHGTATVIEELPPTFQVVVDNLNGLQVGDVVEAIDSGAKGQVSAIVPPSFHVLVTKNWSGFVADEYVIGPRSKMKVTSQSSAPPAATAIWEEAAMSAYRGWPGCVSKSAQRVVFCRFPQLGPAIAWSSPGTLDDFLIGAEKDDAIFEFVPENCNVLDVIEGSDVFVFTDLGVYYVPTSTTNPLIPGAIEFRKISSDAAAPVRPRETADGLAFINAGLTRVLALIATGQTAKPYLVDDISELHAALLKGPLSIATSSADVAAPERYLYVANNDGTMAVARYQRQQGGRGWVGWVPWDGIGQIEWVDSDASDVIVTARYETDAGALRYAEVFDDTLLLDGSQPLASTSGEDFFLTDDDGDALVTETGELIVVSDGFAYAWAPGVTISVEKDGWYRGDYEVRSDGSLSGVIPATDTFGLWGGFNFTVEVEPFVPHVDPGPVSKKQRLHKRRIKTVAATVQRAQALEVAGRIVPFWRAGENQEEAPPLRDETYRSRVLGRDWDPRWSVRQDLPGPLTILELATEVTI